MSRRAAVLSVLVALGVAGMALAPLKARQNVAEIEKVKDNLYVIKGGGGNTAAFVTANGVVVVDTKLAGWGQAILDKIKSVTDKPVTMIINTHTHGDHVGSNPEFPATVDVVAHENTKANMEKMAPFQSDAGRLYLPKRTFKDRMTLRGGPDRIDLYYFGRGHTNGDAIIVFPSLGAAHFGDLFPSKAAPLIDTRNGGSGVDYPKTLAAAADSISGVDVVIRGHSDNTDWKAVRDYTAYMQALVTATEQAVKAGKSADEAASSITLPEQFKDYQTQSLKADIAVIYAELKK